MIGTVTWQQLPWYLRVLWEKRSQSLCCRFVFSSPRPLERPLKTPHTVAPRRAQAQMMADTGKYIRLRAFFSIGSTSKYSQLALCRSGGFRILRFGLVQVCVQVLVHDGPAKYTS